MKRSKSFVLSAILLVAGLAQFATAQNFGGQPLAGGIYIAAQYNYGGAGAGTSGITPNSIKTTAGPGVTGSGTVTVGYPLIFVNGRKIMPFSVTAPILIGGNANQETVTPTAVSCSTADNNTNVCTITATFSNAHGAGEPVASGSFGLQEAINDAQASGSGIVVVDQSWAKAGGTNATLVAALVYPGVAIEDRRSGVVQWWNPVSNATFAAVPATLTATTVGFGINGANTTGGTYNGASTYHYCVSYVDVMGNEGPCSLDFSAATAGTGSANQIGFSAPAASTGMVGYVPYISLAGGTYALAYRVPLATYSNGIPTGNGVCTLTTIETVTAACALANTTYNQSGSAAIVSALTVNTARLAAQLGAASTTSDIVSNSPAHTVWTYAPGSRAGIGPGVVTSHAPFTVTTAAASTVPAILGTIHLPAGFMNFVGKTIRICGHATSASGGTATVETIQMVWDADGSNTTGAGVIIGNGLNLTSTETATASTYNFCEVIRTTVSGAGATAGSIQSAGGYIEAEAGQTATSNRTAGDTSVATTASLNLANEARIDVQYVHTTGTDGSGLILQNLTVEVLN